MEDLDNQIALLHARIADLDKTKAELGLTQIDFYRAKQLLGTPAESRQQYDRAQKALSTADARVNEALAEVYQARASLGLPVRPVTAKISAKCRQISMRSFLLSSRRRQT